ncbi:ABC transporter permease [Maritimibacter alkaliphilus]|uniref:ABC transporter permease n=1 Tax=Maritimibacter alkaliphilus TaxID=404236 RepID=UPI001C96562B|nr:ABC transporter permease [Maritimibacter alkaliphilus]MBY6088941.1 ABC transporter permease [Maritimibacter alkaliphilus]
MTTFLLRRILQLVPVLFGVSIAVFAMIHAIPGDPAEMVAGIDATPHDVEIVRQRLGLDQPLLQQYLIFVGNALTGDFGTSFRTGLPVSEEIMPRFYNTMVLSVAALIISVVVGFVSGVVSAVWKFSIFDNVSLLVSLIGLSMPPFFLGLVLLMVFSVDLGWFPMSGMGDWRHLVLPAVTLGLPSGAVVARMTRSSLIDVLDQDYIRTARAKGLPEYTVVNSHAVRNALIPVITIVGLQMGFLLGGAVVCESVFAWPGIGRLTVQAILARDFPVIQASVLLLAVIFVVVNFLTDLLYGVFDPRIKVQ